ncbi:hypothetical protein BDV96DRAFT_603191 [Lophiotrema nucula]|uniref:Uncharacterized protein n=1 Tax=Lophiotrema nucula TaxID=690887 RepID=A0A6A5YV92_9PLEO|nr:hypothetical protein BDV96DRAFT_603191 [Lophiotrema nucula]
MTTVTGTRMFQDNVGLAIGQETALTRSHSASAGPGLPKGPVVLILILVTTTLIAGSLAMQWANGNLEVHATSSVSKTLYRLHTDLNLLQTTVLYISGILAFHY